MFTNEELARALYWEGTRDQEVMRWDELSESQKKPFYNMADFVLGLAPMLKK